ncbi:MAG: hypothetical protein RL385_2570 [Pseudomonadota bacterium]|jgi:hypothetical protein
MLTLATALRLTGVLTGAVLVQQSAELLALRRAYAEYGVFGRDALAPNLPRLPGSLTRLLAPALGEHGLRMVLWLRLLLGASLVALPVHPGTAFSAAFCTLFVCMRFGGVFNGGSDYMTMALQLGIACASLGGVGSRAGLTYIAVQSLASYTIAGIVKVKEASWRNGSAVASFLNHPHYGAPAWVKGLVQNRQTALLLSWSVMLFECLMPCCLLSPALAMVGVGVAFGFHAGTVLAFGLNRFLWAWAATYPAILWLSAAA